MCIREVKLKCKTCVVKIKEEHNRVLVFAPKYEQLITLEQVAVQ
ncbi:hypothetical protein TcasGA2_TC031510 [Tribolium castaneum]|uniref:Uncharacterized protein n=1 Tax=Tribolium castaneum TaxID=7070 RepID=A0A139WNZ7_TRICA|nr:hypothetical protein TcasGA2_TC031510 [Tribolium castaneum]